MENFTQKRFIECDGYITQESSGGQSFGNLIGSVMGAVMKGERKGETWVEQKTLIRKDKVELVTYEQAPVKLKAPNPGSRPHFLRTPAEHEDADNAARTPEEDPMPHQEGSPISNPY